MERSWWPCALSSMLWRSSTCWRIRIRSKSLLMLSSTGVCVSISDFYGIIQLLRKHMCQLSTYMCGFMVMFLNHSGNLFQNFYQYLLDYAYDFLPFSLLYCSSMQCMTLNNFILCVVNVQATWALGVKQGYEVVFQGFFLLCFFVWRIKLSLTLQNTSWSFCLSAVVHEKMQPVLDLQVLSGDKLLIFHPWEGWIRQSICSPLEHERVLSGMWRQLLSA